MGMFAFVKDLDRENLFPLFFVLVLDFLSTMLNHVLNLGILYVTPFG